MSLETLKDFVTSKAARQILLTQKHSPRILFVVGSVGIVTAGVLACRATLKLNDVLDEGDLDLKVTDGRRSQGHLSDEEHHKKSAKVKLKTATRVVGLYAPAIGVATVSVAALTGSHVILTKRNGAAMAAYAMLDRGYKEYRQRVTEEYGSDVDRKFAAGAEKVVIEEKLADGTTKSTTKDIVKKDGKYGGSPYSIVFDEHSKFFSREPGRNAMTIQMKQSYANDKLRAQGHLFLNEVYDMLGAPRTKAGACVGWVWRRESEPKNGDNYVDFGVFNGDPEWVDSFVNGSENLVVLDFNVDGMILELI